MRLSRADLTAVFLTGTMAFASTTLYFVDQPKSRSRGNEKPVGTLIQKIRVAERKSGDEVIWEEVNNKSPVYNGDSIRTAKNSLATLKLDDGTDLDLEQDSLIVLSMDQDGMNVNFAHGALSAKRSENPGTGGTEGSKLKIKSGDKVVKIDKSDVSIAGGENKAFTAMVTKGTAEITSGREKVTLKQDEKATVAEKSEKMEVKIVPLRLRSPDPGVRRVTRGEKERLRFEWQGNEGDTEILEISDRPDFSSLAVRRPAPGRTSEEDLAEGNWYWRVRGKNETSEMRTIRIQRDQPVTLLEPRSGSSFTYSEAPPLIPLAWSENPLVGEYQIVVSRDEAGKEIIKNQTSGKNRISLTGLPEGDYFWRVIYTVDLSRGAEETRTAPFRFTIKKEETILAAALTSPENKTSIRQDQLTNKGLSLLWSGGNERRTDFNVIVAKDASLKNPVLRKELSLPYFQVNAALDEG
ncbi:MAG: FecR domain-containing protein, partial [Spirochaetia bacterium]|nr:FecR domain-containing protein [Spirochaetia bacterium]